MTEISYRLPQEIRLNGQFPGPKSKALADRRAKVVPGGVASSVPVYAADADGGVIVDVDGNSLVDLGSGIAVTSVGASAPKVVEAVQEASQHFTHTCFMVTPYEGYVAVAEKLAEVTPGDFEKRSVLFNSGAEAVENAVKVARAATGRNAVVVFDHAYHGRTNLTMALTAKAAPYKRGFGPFASEVYRVPMSYPYREPAEIDGKEAAERAILQIEKQIGGQDVAAILIEPIQGEGGFIVPEEGFLPRLAEWARENGIVFIADEVQAGFCRTGKWFAVDHEGVEPDLVTLAKGIAGGMPLSAVTGRADLLDAVGPGGLGGTYGGNPVACAAALASIETMEEWNLNERAASIEKSVRSALEPLVDELDIVGEVRGRGAMMAVELVSDSVSKKPHPSAAKDIAAYCLERGVVILTCGTYGNIIRLLPPLTIGDDLLDEALAVLVEGIRSV
ncbi:MULTISPECIES: 4-aminobutyrate--2-oxoglutarate transaminase [Kocuria]|uniref:4-aminobutyrate--2-oxoglutarate transaminase n=1 Tax=Kocuria TaxID=57493 RepID=UPI0006612117|nr:MULTISPECIES: 4-aminobutyrate--2-oxoglutarate transaminase [Kocuria]RUQ19869.1 4-aminobutyrate--2-oxoglutarate transaminase [Kocuria sp. HSID16901]